MTSFGPPNRPGDPDDPARQAVHELLDRYHPRASIQDGDKMIVEAGQVLENIAFAMDRVDTDINTPISIVEDVASSDELTTLIQRFQMGPILVSHRIFSGVHLRIVRSEIIHAVDWVAWINGLTLPAPACR